MFEQLKISRNHPACTKLAQWYPMIQNHGAFVPNIIDGKSNGLLTNSQISTISGYSGSPWGGSILFDGVDDYVALGSSEMGWMTSSSFSLSCWVKTNNAMATNIVPFGRGYIEASGVHGIHWEITPTLMEFFRNTGGVGAYRYSRATVTIPIDRFVHVVVVYDKENITHRQYVNGESYSLTYPNSPVDTADLSINGTYDAGYNTGGQIRNISNIYSKAFITNFRIYSRALFDHDVKLLYNEPFAGLERNFYVGKY